MWETGLEQEGSPLQFSSASTEKAKSPVKGDLFLMSAKGVFVYSFISLCPALKATCEHLLCKPVDSKVGGILSGVLRGSRESLGVQIILRL